ARSYAATEIGRSYYSVLLIQIRCATGAVTGCSGLHSYKKSTHLQSKKLKHTVITGLSSQRKCRSLATEMRLDVSKRVELLYEIGSIVAQETTGVNKGGRYDTFHKQICN